MMKMPTSRQRTPLRRGMDTNKLSNVAAEAAGAAEEEGLLALLMALPLTMASLRFRTEGDQPKNHQQQHKGKPRPPPKSTRKLAAAIRPNPKRKCHRNTILSRHEPLRRLQTKHRECRRFPHLQPETALQAPPRGKPTPRSQRRHLGSKWRTDLVRPELGPNHSR
jgi:hypothetical protein